MGGGGSFLSLRNSPHAARHYPLCSSPFFSENSTLFCTCQKLNPFVFMQFHALCEKHPGVGGDVDLPSHKRVLFRSLPESASFDSRPRPNIQSRRFVGRKPVELYQREQSYEKEFLGVCSRNFRFVWASSARSRASAGTRSEGAGSEACGKM